MTVHVKALHNIYNDCTCEGSSLLTPVNTVRVCITDPMLSGAVLSVYNICRGVIMLHF